MATLMDPVRVNGVHTSIDDAVKKGMVVFREECDGKEENKMIRICCKRRRGKSISDTRDVLFSHGP
jgi:hypothetical protein